MQHVKTSEFAVAVSSESEVYPVRYSMLINYKRHKYGCIILLSVAVDDDG